MACFMLIVGSCSATNMTEGDLPLFMDMLVTHSDERDNLVF